MVACVVILPWKDGIAIGGKTDGRYVDEPGTRADNGGDGGWLERYADADLAARRLERLEPSRVAPSPNASNEPVDVPSPTCPDVPYAEVLCAFEWDPWTAARIVRCESTFRSDAVGDGSYGLFQIQASVHSWKWPDFWEAWANPMRNAEYAWEIYQGRGWYAWSCF